MMAEIIGGLWLSMTVCILKYLTHNNPLFGNHFAGVPSTKLNLPIIPESAYASALKEYEDINDSEGDGW